MPDVAKRTSDGRMPGPVAATDETAGMAEMRQELKRAQQVLAEARATSKTLLSLLAGPSDQAPGAHVLEQDDEALTQAERAA